MSVLSEHVCGTRSCTRFRACKRAWVFVCARDRASVCVRARVLAVQPDLETLSPK
jgi:hypothetical protein